MRVLVNMSQPHEPSEGFRSAASRFDTTHWSLVLTARDTSSPTSAEAMGLLCRTYWYPLYAYVRRQGENSHDAQDLTQEFFARLLEKGYLHAAAAEKGRFRTFLLVALKRFLANEWDRARALKRGGGRPHLPLDAAGAESRYQTEPADALTPERIFERRWAITVVEQTLVRLRAEYERLERLSEFERLKEFLTAERGTIPYGEVAAALGVSAGAARAAVHRLRERFRALFREQIAQTVSNPDDLEDELRYVVAALGGG
jgi:RNA polymerase sigma-70 factor (ECF subfamily)